MPSTLAPPPIMPGSALRLLHQGRAQGLFTPSTSTLSGGYNSPGPYYPSGGGGYSPSSFTQTPPQNLKRNRSEADIDSVSTPAPIQISTIPVQTSHSLDAAPDIHSRPPSTTPRFNGEEGPSPAKRPRKEPTPPQPTQHVSRQSQPARNQSNGISRPPSSLSGANGKRSPALDVHPTRFASKPVIPRGFDPSIPLKDNRRAAVIGAICQHDDPVPVLDLLREISPEVDVDIVLDDQGHTALHLAASMARQHIVDSLVASGADIHRGNYLGETPLIRACLATHNNDRQTFQTLVACLNQSIRTLDTSRKSVIHHIVSLAGVKGRAVAARYYLDQIFYWIAQNQGGDFKALVDLQDEHGDTALNIAARVGNRSLVRTLLDVGANRALPNKLGLRPGDFGVETDVSLVESSYHP